MLINSRTYIDVLIKLLADVPDNAGRCRRLIESNFPYKCSLELKHILPLALPIRTVVAPGTSIRKLLVVT